MRQFYIMNGQNQEGPFDIEQIKQHNIKKDTPIWYEGLENWTTAEKVEDLNSILTKNLNPPKFENLTDISSGIPPNFKASGTTEEILQIDSQSNKKKLTSFEKINSKKKLIIGASCLCVFILLGYAYEAVFGFSSFSNQEQLIPCDTCAVASPDIVSDNITEEYPKDNNNNSLSKKNMAYRNNWYELITTQLGEYNYREIGGIDPFVVQVTNDTEYKLDNVDVDIEYIKSNGEVYDTETLVFKNVSANSNLQLYSSGSERGTSARAQISNIGSSKMNFCYPSDNGNQNDPYFCK